MELKILLSNPLGRFSGILRKPFLAASHRLSPRFVMLITFMGMSLINYAFSFATGWLLLPGDFGLLAFSQTLLTITGLVLNSGFSWSLAAALVGAADKDRSRLVRGTGVANLSLGVFMGLAVVVLYWLGPLKPGLESWPAAALVAGSLPLLSGVATARATLQGSERFGALASLWLIETGVKAATGIGLVLLGFGAVGAIAGFFIGSLVASLVGWLVLVKGLRISVLGRLQIPSFQRVGAMFSALIGIAMLLNLDLLALKIFNPGERAVVGYYQAGTILANTPYYMLTAMFPVIFTQIVRKKTIKDSAAIVGETVQLALSVMLPIELLLALFPQTFLRLLFPAAYLAGAPALQLLALGNAAVILVAILSTTFQGIGRASTAGRTLLAVILVEAVILSMTIPAWNSRGAAATFLSAAGITLIILGARYLHQLDQLHRQSALRWFGKYSLTVLLGLLMGSLVLVLFKNDWLAIISGGSLYLLGLFGFKLFSIAALVQKTAHSQARVISTEEG